MPQIIPFVVTAITAVTSAVVAAGPLAVAAFNAVNVIGAAALAQAAFGAVQPQVKSSSSAIEWTADPNAPNRFPFGRVGGAGNIIHNATFGPDLMYAGFVGVLGCSGPIKGYVGFKADQTPVTFDGTGKAISSEFANEMWLIRQRGLQPEPSALPTPSGLKNGVSMPGWGSSYKLSGKAAYIYVLGENSKRSAYKGKVPTGIHTFEGLYCYDPRLDSTYPGGTGSCRLNDPATWVYSTNAYIHALNWVIGRWEGLTAGAAGAPYASMKVGGIGARPEGIDFAGYVEAANVFDENEWVCAAWPDADESKAAVLDSFLQAGGGLYAERQGRISCIHRAAPRASIATITAEDTAGTIEYDTTSSLLDRINTIRPEYWSEAHDWQMVATDEVTSSVWREEDGQGVEVTRSKGIGFNYVPGSKQARELAALLIGQTREPIRGTAPLRHYLDLEPGDCITFAVPDAVLNGQKVLILNVDPDLENDVLMVTFASETDGNYAFAFGQADAPPPLPSIVPYSVEIAAPEPGDWSAAAGMITGDDGSEAPAIVLTGSVENETAEQVIFEYRRVGASTWSPASVESPAVVLKRITGLVSGSWETAVSYRRGNRTSDRLELEPVSLDAIKVPITDEIKDEFDLVFRPPGSGGGLFTGDLDAVGATYVDASVGGLENDLLTGAVKPAEAGTFTGAGALAMKDAVNTTDIVANAVIAPMVVAPAGTVTTAGATSAVSYVEVFDFDVSTQGEPLIFMPSFMAKFWHPAGGDFSVTFRFLRIGFGQVRPDVVVDAINGDQYHGWQTPWFTDTPPAGTHTYEIRAWASTDSGFSHRDISDRQLIVLRLPASTL